MPEIVNFVNRGAAAITPAIMEKVLRQLPQWKLEFTQIRAPLFPHLVDQLEFLADAIEDTGEGVYKDLPYFALAEAAFALLYAHKKLGIIPDSVLNLGRADDFEDRARRADPERKSVRHLRLVPRRGLEQDHQRTLTLRRRSLGLRRQTAARRRDPNRASAAAR